MSLLSPKLRDKRFLFCGSGRSLAFLFLALILSNNPTASALPAPGGAVRALPAFARKYGMPCSSCHQAWPMLSPFGQAFKDNGYQLGNDRDAPIFQQPAYWPVTFRITPIWHRENENRAAVDGPAGAAPLVFPAGEVRYTVSGGRAGEGVFVEVDAVKANHRRN